MRGLLFYYSLIIDIDCRVFNNKRSELVDAKIAGMYIAFYFCYRYFQLSVAIVFMRISCYAFNNIGIIIIKHQFFCKNGCVLIVKTYIIKDAHGSVPGKKS